MATDDNMERINAVHDYDKRVNRHVESLQKEKTSNSKKILDFYYSLKSEGLHEATQEKYLDKLSRIVEWIKKDFKKVTRKEMENIIKKNILENSNLSDNTKKDYKTTIKRFYQWLFNCDKGEFPSVVSWIKNGRIKENKPSPEEMLDDEDIEKMIAVAEHPRDKAFLITLAESGCRIGEILTLSIKSLNFDDRGCFFKVNGKTGERRVRVVNATPFLQSWLSIHPDKTNKDSPLWCSIGTVKNISRKGKVDAVSNRVREYKNIGKCEQEYKLNWSFAMTYPAARSLIIRIAKKAGITKPINPHNFRHSRATLLGAAGLNQSLMNEIMGWAQGSKMSGVYIHMSGKQTDDALLPALYGMKVEENKDKQPKMFPIKCPKCQKVNDYNAERCIECNHLLIESHEVVIREKQKENEFEEMKKNMKLLQQRFDSLYGTVALNEMENGNDFGSISDEGMLPPIEMKITKVQQAKVNKNWIRTIKK